MAKKVYVAIDLKSFYASAECVARGLDPLHTNLVVADAARTEKTICLAVSPSLKGYGISGRARLFEVVQKVAAVNEQRQRAYPQHRLCVREYDDRLIRSDPSLALDYIVAPPRMAYYMEISTKIYQIYLRYVAPEDIHVYSIDEVFIDATNYLPLYGLNARGFARKLMAAVLQETGITATAGVGPNLFLCKVAMDVGAKHIKPDKNGARIAELDERSFREKLWSHRPLTDFWRVGKGYAKKLEANGMYTLGDVARRSLTDEDLLYRLFGVNAELLIDHAWGWEPCRMADIKAYCREKLLSIPGVVPVGQGEAPHILAVSLVGYPSANIVTDLGAKGICISAGSACHRGKASHVVSALHLDKKTAAGVIRVSFGPETTRADIDGLYQALLDHKNQRFPML